MRESSVLNREVRGTGEEMRWCQTGHHYVAQNLFYRSSLAADGLSSRCIECDRTAKLNYRPKPPSPYRAMYARQNHTPRSVTRHRESRWWRAGIRLRGGPFTERDYETLWTVQRGLCGLCQKPMSREHRWPDVDHDPRTHEVRSLLHPFCNRDVGRMDSRRALLVLNYLLKHERGRTEVGRA